MRKNQQITNQRASFPSRERENLKPLLYKGIGLERGFSVPMKNQNAN